MRSHSSLRNIVVALVILFTSAAAFAQIGISVSFGPPEIPLYDQPVCPEDGYLWTPGYWAYDYDFGDYYWVPGTWVQAPEVGYLWTPGYWGWGGEGFLFHEGYWGREVGFYGGVNYGYGFFGRGYEGGRWDGQRFFYNRAVSNVNVVNIHNVYNTRIINNTTINRVSYNGGRGGITVRPNPIEESAARERHLAPVAVQVQHVQAARNNPQLRASANNGKPPIAATARPGSFTGNGALPAKEAGAPYHAPVARPAGQPVPSPVHASDLQTHQPPSPVATGSYRADNRYQQQQASLVSRQNEQHNQLQQQQNQDHQRMLQQNADQAQKQQVEQQHQQQTQRLEQQHVQQQQHLEQRQPPPQQRQPAPQSHNEGRPR